MSGRILLITFVALTLAAPTLFAQAEAKKPAEIAGKVESSEAPAAPAQLPPLTEFDTRSPTQKKTAESEAQAAYDEANGIATKGLEIGDEGQAFLLYTDALLKLRKIHGKYPDFKAKEVDAKIKEVNVTLKSLEEAKCLSLEQVKMGRFRYLVWKRQLLILNKLDNLEKATKKNEEMLEELKDKLGI